MKSQTKEKSGDLGFYLRFSFWIMIAFWIGNAFTGLMNEGLLLIIWLISIISCFVISIMHLSTYKKKAFAVVSLVLSSYLILTFIIGVMILAYLK